MIIGLAVALGIISLVGAHYIWFLWGLIERLEDTVWQHESKIAELEVEKYREYGLIINYMEEQHEKLYREKFHNKNQEHEEVRSEE